MALDKEKCDYCGEMKDFVLRNVGPRRKLRMCLECHSKTEQKDPKYYGTHKNPSN